MHTSLRKCGDRNKFPPDNNWQGCELSMGRWLDVIKHNNTVCFGSGESTPMNIEFCPGSRAQDCSHVPSSWFLPNLHSSVFSVHLAKLLFLNARAGLLLGPRFWSQFWQSSQLNFSDPQKRSLLMLNFQWNQHHVSLLELSSIFCLFSF